MFINSANIMLVTIKSEIIFGARKLEMFGIVEIFNLKIKYFNNTKYF